MDYETVIGLEVHVQLQTQSKMFCSCRADYQSAAPNTRVCPVCLGLPGAMPVINRKAVEFTIMTGLALNCQIPDYSKFDRKNYPYPDLMKGYQITQYDLPLAVGGYLDIRVDGRDCRIGLERIHLEEDVAKLQHRPSANGESYSLVDVNRSGVPLMEIVSKPDMSSAEEARTYLMTLHSILEYLGVSTVNMQDGSFRCDANISLRPKGNTEYGTRTEVKNMNSFHSVYMALNYEEERQRKVLEDGGASDFRFGGDKNFSFAPVKVDAHLIDGQEIKLGDTVLKTHFTFGHTKGATSWTMDVSDGGKKYKTAFVSSVSLLDYALVNNSGYPRIAEDFAKTFKTLSEIKPDIFLSSHGQFFDLTEKAAKLRAGARTNPFIDPNGYQKFIERTSKAFQDKLRLETAKQK